MHIHPIHRTYTSTPSPLAPSSLEQPILAHNHLEFAGDDFHIEGGFVHGDAVRQPGGGFLTVAHAEFPALKDAVLGAATAATPATPKESGQSGLAGAVHHNFEQTVGRVAYI